MMKAIYIVDQIVDWFGNEVKLIKTDDETKVKVSVKASPMAMEHWAMQYINYVEVISPKALRESIKASINNGMNKYSD